MEGSGWNQRASVDNLALIGAMAAMVIGVVIVAALYLGRDIFIPNSPRHIRNLVRRNRKKVLN
jgi:hypothetical protein